MIIIFAYLGPRRNEPILLNSILLIFLFLKSAVFALVFFTLLEEEIEYLKIHSLGIISKYY